jgi:hypothetical protein
MFHRSRAAQVYPANEVAWPSFFATNNSGGSIFNYNLGYSME